MKFTLSHLFFAVALPGAAAANFDIKTAARFEKTAQEAASLIHSTGGNGAVPPRRDKGPFLRHLEGMSQDETGVADLVTCRAQLTQCLAEGEAPSLLFVQMADECVLSQETQEDGTYVYMLKSNKMDDDTYSFTDRPLQVEGQMPTGLFMSRFEDIFTESSGGKPNAAITFHHQEHDQFEGPLIAVQVEAHAAETTEDFQGYVLEQSESQSSFGALADYFQQDGVSEVLFSDCSIFIDSVVGTDSYLNACQDPGAAAGASAVCAGGKCTACADADAFKFASCAEGGNPCQNGAAGEIGQAKVCSSVGYSHASFSASVDLIHICAMHFEATLGLATGYSFGLDADSFHAEMLGTGVTFGRTLGISLFGTGFKVDLCFWCDDDPSAPGSCEQDGCGAAGNPTGDCHWGDASQWMIPDLETTDGKVIQARRKNAGYGCTYCNGGACVYKRPVGAPCGDYNDCMTQGSGACKNGRCVLT